MKNIHKFVTAGLLSTALFGATQANAAEVKVQKGDSLYKISQTYKVSVDSIKRANNLSGDAIYAGSTLTIPSKNNSGASSSTSTNTHVVQKGDTLSKIARAKGVSVSSLKSLNGLNSDLIRVGQTLKLNGTASSSSPQARASVSQTTSKNNSFDVQSLIAESKKYLGVPYVWGGSTPKGFDCSGYIQYIFNKEGVSLPRTAAMMWDATDAVSSPAVGDLVFFETYKPGPSHVGVYLGSGKFINASSSKGVNIASMDNSYWKARYLGAKEIN